MAYSAKILRDSLSPEGVRLTTFEVTFPRIVLAEFNTHRVFSRNSASSRAIPVKKMLERAKADPFIPVYWGKNQSGMQAAEELSPEAQGLALEQWLLARDNAVSVVERLQMPDIDLHKQIANRLLEPWLWHTVIVTSTEWENWRGLRSSKEAQPEIRRISEMKMRLLDDSVPVKLKHGEWHLPLVNDYLDLVAAGFRLSDIIKICVGRCCRVSYLTHDGKRDPQADIDLFERLLSSGHMSPFEHAARPLNRNVWQHYQTAQDRSRGQCPPFVGNFRGWIQARKLIDHEDNFLLVKDTGRPFEVR